MTRPAGSLPPAYFEALYARDEDPWRFATSAYERAKYAATLAALPQARYGRVLEVGCSIGVLTAQLARRCDDLLAVDVADSALAVARQRCAALGHVRFAICQVPQQWPDGAFDLILLSEVVYYLDAADVRALARRLSAATRPGATVLLVHWTGATDYPLSGDAAASLLLAEMADATQESWGRRAERYRLDGFIVR